MRSEEIKISLTEIEDVMKRLLELGAARQGQTKEIDVYMDDVNRNLSNYSKVLRIRENGRKTLLCFKDMRNLDGAVLGKKEIDVEIPETKKFLDILAGLGFRPIGKVEKIRQKYVYQRVVICLDKLPFMGYFLDITGHKENVDLAAERLRIDRTGNITKNYLELFQEFLRDNGIKVQDERELTFLSETRYEKI